MTGNDEVARLFEEFADRLEATGVDYKPRAYRRAAENVRAHDEPVAELAAEGPAAVQAIDGVGDALAEKVVEYVETGEIAALAELRTEFPVDVDALTTVEGLGPKRVGALYDALGVETLDDLAAAAEAGRIREVEGFGPKTETKIAESVAFARRAAERTPLGRARPVARAAAARVAEGEGVERCAVVGSVRRWRATVGDADVLAAAADPEPAVEALVGWERAGERLDSPTGAASVRVDGVRVDLRVARPAEFGAARQYFTGSEAHNAGLRERAAERDLKLNECGVFDISGVPFADADQRAGERVAGEREAGTYDALGLAPIPPELREAEGEIERAAAGALPDLVAVDDVRGDLHVHTAWSDGDATVAEMVAGAADAGHDYVAISDHATGPGVVGGMGLTDDDLRDQMGVVEDLRSDADVAVLTGVEANVDADGDLSVGDDVLAELDVVVASPHSALDQDREAATRRLVRAVEHPAVDVLGHPTGRRLGRRPGLDVDASRVAAAARDAGTALEVNASPSRLDLRDEHVRTAVEAGARVVVNTDAHRPEEFGQVRYGVHTARRGWAETAHVLNTLPVEDLRAFLH